MTTRKANTYEARFLCPLSGEIMRDPVVDADGNSYERINILVWLDDRGKSPLTGRLMKKEELKSNQILKDTIEQALEEQKQRNAEMDATGGWQFDAKDEEAGYKEASERTKSGMVQALFSRSNLSNTNFSPSTKHTIECESDYHGMEEKKKGKVRFADR